MNILLILVGKIISKLLQLLNVGNGTTWPGHIALQLNKHFIQDLLLNSSMKIIIVAGTNGKTTTASLIKDILEKDQKKVLLNNSGANLLNGIASTMLLHATPNGKLLYDVAIFEVDENVLPLLLKELTPDFLVLLNLFRDQLDRYGEVHSIADKWEEAIKQLFNCHPGRNAVTDLPAGRQGRILSRKDSIAPVYTEPAEVLQNDKAPIFILNADDPEIAWLGLQQNEKSVILNNSEGSSQDSSPIAQNDNILYFGLNNKTLSKQTRDHAVDSVYCPKCNFPLEYKTNYYSHLGDWYCPDCNLQHPKLSHIEISHYPLSGTYNLYNTHAAVLVAQQIGIDAKTIESALHEFKPAFGRQEIITYQGKKIQLFLSKNPTSFNQSLQTIHELGGKNLLIVLNDRVADGHDVSWIWDANLEQYLPQFTHISLAGDRCYDLGLRIKYAQRESRIMNHELRIEPELEIAIENALVETKGNETLFILPTYTAMLEIRKILTGKKIL